MKYAKSKLKIIKDTQRKKMKTKLNVQFATDIEKILQLNS